MTKRLMSLLVACLLVFGVFPVEIMAAEPSDNAQEACWSAMAEKYEQSDNTISLEEKEQLLAYPLMSGVATFDVGDKMFEEIEPNDRMSLADNVFSGYTVAGTLSGMDLDYYKLTLTSRSEVRCAAASSADSLGLGIFDKNEEIQESALQLDYADGVYTYGCIATLDAGTYYIVALDTEESAFNQYLFYVETAHVHNWGEGSFDIDAETVTYTCKECGETKTEAITIDKEAVVYRISGADRNKTALETAERFKELSGIDKFNAVIVATGKNFADALSGSYLAYVKDAPILLTNGKNVEEVKSYIKANLMSGGTIYLLGGTAAVPSTMETGLDEYNVVRFSGKSRYETNQMILEEAGVGNGEIVVCTGKNYADSLSASAVKKPILLVKGALTDAQKIYLQDKEIDLFYIIGGTGAVSENVANELHGYGSVERIYGSTRYETSAAVAMHFFENADDAVLAYGKNFPDGLCGGPLACALDAPLILAATGKIAAACDYTDTYSIEKGYVLGGAGLISDDAARAVFNKSSDTTIVVY